MSGEPTKAATFSYYDLVNIKHYGRHRLDEADIDVRPLFRFHPGQGEWRRHATLLSVELEVDENDDDNGTASSGSPSQADQGGARSALQEARLRDARLSGAGAGADR